MNEEQKQALIEDCQDEISKLERAIRSVNSYAKPAYRDEFISEYQSQLKRQQIALAALTAQPVKLPQLELAATLTLKDGEYEWDRICYIPDGEHDLYIMKEDGE